MLPPQIRLLPDGRRLHLQHGPIDLIVGADGDAVAVRAAFGRAADRFATILDELCSELPLLRSPVERDADDLPSPLRGRWPERSGGPDGGRAGGTPSLDPQGPPPPSPPRKGEESRDAAEVVTVSEGPRASAAPAGAIAGRMFEAVAPFAADTFITPMAAVAGAVAEAVLAAMCSLEQGASHLPSPLRRRWPERSGDPDGGGAGGTKAFDPARPPPPSPPRKGEESREPDDVGAGPALPSSSPPHPEVPAERASKDGSSQTRGLLRGSAFSRAPQDEGAGAAGLTRAYVNNGGDIALYLAPGESFRIGLIDRPDPPSILGTTEIHAEDGINGIATSGWRGRSFSLGIADAVTVLAATAPQADAAATIIANAVDLPGHPAIRRERASDIQPDNDLGDRLVTRDVGPLRENEIDTALARGIARAETLIAAGLIRAAALHCAGVTRVVGWPRHIASPEHGPQSRPNREVEHAHG